MTKKPTWLRLSTRIAQKAGSKAGNRGGKKKSKKSKVEEMREATLATLFARQAQTFISDAEQDELASC